MEEELYLWYSRKQEDHYKGKTPPKSCSFYRTHKGDEVRVTLVTGGPDHGTLWDDIVLVGRGPVNGLIRTERTVTP